MNLPTADELQTPSEVPDIVLIELAPMTNLLELQRRFPHVALDRVRVVAMAGSLRRGYNNETHPVAEYNVATDIPATSARAAMTAYAAALGAWKEEESVLGRRANVSYNLAALRVQEGQVEEAKRDFLTARSLAARTRARRAVGWLSMDWFMTLRASWTSTPPAPNRF